MQMARDAGSVLMQKLGTAKVSTKGDINLVTEADLASEQLIIERIRSYYPQHGILAEESGEAVLVGKRSEWKWIIDPLDGTTNYAHGYPCFCVSIALEYAGVLEIGVVYDPVRDEMFASFRGKHLITHRIVNDPDFQHARVFQRDRNTEAGITVRVIRRAVERIDNPFPLTAFANQNRLARLFCQYSVLRIVRTDSFDDELFRSEIGFSDEIDVAFGADL